MSTRRPRLVASLIPLMILASGCSSGTGGDAGSAQDKVTLTLNWVPYGEHAPFYYGLAEGIYAAEGIRLTIQPGGGSGKTVQAVAGGQTDFGWADTPALASNVASGATVKSLGVFLQTTPASVEFFADEGIKEPADIKGKTIATTAGDALSASFPAFLKANGLKESDVETQNVDPAGKIAALISGQVDAILGFCHDQSPNIEAQSGKKVRCLKFSESGVNFFSTGLIANTELIEKDQDLVERMVRATIKSWEAALDKPKAAVEAMFGAVGNLVTSQDVLANQFALMQDLGLLSTKNSKGKRPGVNVAADWQATLELLKKYAGLTGSTDPAAYWDGTFADAA